MPEVIEPSLMGRIARNELVQSMSSQMTPRKCQFEGSKTLIIGCRASARWQVFKRDRTGGIDKSSRRFYCDFHKETEQ